MYYQKTVEYNKLIEIVKQKSIESNVIYNKDYVYDYNFKIKDNQVYIDYNFLKEKIDPSIELSNSRSRIYIDISKLKFELETKEITEYVKKNLGKINIPLRFIENKKYVNIDILSKIYNINYRVLKNEKVIYIDDDLTDSFYELYKNKNLFFYKNDNLIKFDNLKKGSEVIYIDDLTIKGKDYIKVIANNGEIGYVSNSNLLQKDKKISKDIKINKIRDKKSIETVSLIWDSINNYNDSKNFNLKANEMINIVSPTWFNLNIDGIVINSASLKYIQDAKRENVSVWGLYKNNFNPKWTNQLLSSDKYIDKSISQLLFYSALYNLDGINIDFENVYLKDKDKLTQYVKKIKKYTDMQNLYLSIDAVVPGGSDRYSKVIDRKEISKYIDYFILMAYDEHWGSSPVSGSVASLPWVEKGIKNTLKNIPNNKLVLGIPLYMRIWFSKNNSLYSKAYSMKNIKSFLDKIKYKIEYDLDSGQNFIESTYKDQNVKIWLEDELSLNKRIELIKKYKLAGAAGWRKGYEKNIYYKLLEKIIK
ncbi:MAG: glycosyl hydrolase family 18 protein [Bacillota bacterium]